MHVVIAADLDDGDVGPFVVELERVLEVRGVPGAILVGQNECDRAHGVVENAPLLVERHQWMERQLEALVARERVLIVADWYQAAAGQNAGRLVRQLGPPVGRHFGQGLVERVRGRAAAAAMPPV